MRPLLPLLLAASLSLVPGGAEAMGTIDLAGSWQSAVGDGSGPLGSPDTRQWSSCSLPATWAGLHYREVVGPIWFRREIVLPERWRERLAPSGLAVIIGAGGYGSYEIYAGGAPVAAYGGPGLTLPAPQALVFSLPADAVGDDGVLVLALRYERSPWTPGRYAEIRGPVGNQVLLGDLETLRWSLARERLRAFNATLPVMVLAVLLTAVALYHLQLYVRRRESVEYLWFALTVLDFVAIIFLQNWAHQLTPSYSLAQRLMEAAVHLVLPLLIQFVSSFLSRPIPRHLKAYQLSHLVLAAFALFAPSFGWLLLTRAGRWAWGLPGWIYLSVQLARKLRRGDVEARSIGLGGLALTLAGSVEWISQTAGWGSTLPLPLWAAGAFAVAMTVSLSSRFNRIHQELDGLRLRLEQMVEDRTNELKIANDKIASEIAERRLAEEAMRMLERAVEQSIDGILVTDLEGKIQFLNQAWAQMHGCEVFDVLGKNLSLFHTPEQLAVELRPCLEVVKETGAFEGEIGHRRGDGSTFPTWMSITLVRDPDAGPVGFAVVGRDISERKKGEGEQAVLEAKVQHAKKLESLGDLAGGIAHDYNNVLTGVLGNSSLLLRDLVPGSPARDKIELIEAAAERAADLTAQLLAYAGEDPLVVRKLELGELVQETELRRLVAPNATLELRLEGELPSVAVDPVQIRRAIRNLVSNASAALGGEPGSVTVCIRLIDVDPADLEDAALDDVRDPGECVSIEVRDTGGGISDEVKRRMFEPFFSTRASARGLGLATVFGIVRGHRGAIKVTSRPGEGTAFELLFPVAVERVAPRPEPLPRFEGSGTVLVVDDERLMREVSESILEECGFEVLTAASGPQALQIYRRERQAIQVVLLDNRMPEMNGFEVLQEIRRLEPAAQVILMSGYQEKDVLSEVVDPGISGFLQKPFRPDDLLRKVREALQGSDPEAE